MSPIGGTQVSADSMDTNETALYVNCSASALRNWRRRGSGPPFIRMNRLIRYMVEDVDAWINENRSTKATPVSSTTQEAALGITADDITFLTGEK